MQTDTPLRTYLQRVGKSAEAFALEHGLSAWSVRHWVRGDKVPALVTQVAISTATTGEVSPEDWLNWTLERQAA